MLLQPFIDCRTLVTKAVRGAHGCMPSRVEQDSSRPGLGGRKTNPTSPGRSTHQRPHSLATTSLHQGVYTLRDGRQLELKGGGQLTVCWTGEGGTEFSGNLVQYPKVQVQKGKAMWAKIKKGKGKKAGRMSFGSAALAVLQKEKNGAAPSPDQEPAGEDVVSPSMTGILLIAKNCPKRFAPITNRKMNAVRRIVSSRDPPSIFQLNFLDIMAKNNAPNAPIPAASVGVNIPK